MDSMQKCEHKVKGKKIGFPPNKKGGKQILKFKWGGGTKGWGGWGGGHDFWLKFSAGKNLGENFGMSNRYQVGNQKFINIFIYKFLKYPLDLSWQN